MVREREVVVAKERELGGRELDIGLPTWIEHAPEHSKGVLHVSAGIGHSAYERETDRKTHGSLSNRNECKSQLIGRVSISVHWAGRMVCPLRKTR